MAYNPKPGTAHLDEAYLYDRSSLASFIFENVLRNTNGIKQFNFDLPFVNDNTYLIDYVRANTFSKKHNRSIDLFAQSPCYYINSLIHTISHGVNNIGVFKCDGDIDGKKRVSIDNFLRNDLIFDNYYELDPEMVICAYFSGIGKVAIVKQDTDLLLLCRNSRNNGNGNRLKLLIIEAKPYIQNVGDKKDEEDMVFLKQILKQLNGFGSLALKYQIPTQGIAILYNTETLDPQGIVLGMEYFPSDMSNDILVYDENRRVLRPNKYLRKSGVINALPVGCNFFN